MIKTVLLNLSACIIMAIAYGITEVTLLGREADVAFWKIMIVMITWIWGSQLYWHLAKKCK